MQMKNRILKDKQSISTFTIKEIVSKWDSNETIMNLASRVKELDIENGILKSDLVMLEHKLSSIGKKNIIQLRQENKKLKNTIENNNLKIKNQSKKLSELQYLLKIEKTVTKIDSLK